SHGRLPFGGRKDGALFVRRRGGAMSPIFDLTTGRLAVGDPTMGLAQCSLALPAGAYRLGPRAFRSVDKSSAVEPVQSLIEMDSPCVFALDAALVEEFEAWHHRVGDERSHMVHTIAKELREFEGAV